MCTELMRTRVGELGKLRSKLKGIHVHSEHQHLAKDACMPNTRHPVQGRVPRVGGNGPNMRQQVFSSSYNPLTVVIRVY